jgi:predicted flap endonuclease-1-like 5' DNA nuclease
MIGEIFPQEVSMATIADVEGIGPAYAKKLQKAGIRSTASLLKKGATPGGRKAIAEKTGLSPALILEWVNHVDLYRIKGVGSEYSDLLEEAGVDTVPELAQRNAANLTKEMVAANKKKKLVRKLPSERQIAGWIKQAKKLPRIVHY